MFGILRLKRLIPDTLKQRALSLFSTILRIKKYGFNYRGNTKGITFLSDGSNPTFFGYHDKTPFSADGSKILAMSIDADEACQNVLRLSKEEFVNELLKVALT